MTARGYLLFASIVAATLLVNTVSIRIDYNPKLSGFSPRKHSKGRSYRGRGKGRSFRLPFIDSLSVIISTRRYGTGAVAAPAACDLIVYDETDRELFLSEIWRHVYSTEDLREGSSDSDGDSDDDREVELEIANELDEVVTMCWVNEQGYLRNFSVINDKSIRDGSVSHRHTEYTFRGHCFVVFRRAPAAAGSSSSGSSSSALPAHLREIKQEDFVCLYKPLRAGCRHLLALRRDAPAPGRCIGRVVASSRCEELCDEEVIDTSRKTYLEADMCGWRVLYEAGSLESHSVGAALREDLRRCSELLPPGAMRRLSLDTHIYLNRSLTYGTRSRPIEGRSCTYHSINGGQWLRRNGMSERKRGCVEIFSPSDYVESRSDWGPGGGLLHELCHAYHDKICPGGFDGETVRDAYLLAMQRGLYDRVAVHGRQGSAGPAKAYACTNRMEYFAELSVAYLYRDADEYNKWYPHNRQQLRQHDPQSFAVLELMWS